MRALGKDKEAGLPGGWARGQQPKHEVRHEAEHSKAALSYQKAFGLAPGTLAEQQGRSFTWNVPEHLPLGYFSGSSPWTH